MGAPRLPRLPHREEQPMTARTLEQVRADAERAGRTGECELGEH
ncbi:hypothetical protein [Streptomyces sp. CC53]|nr:hypothetical protein [Streptomyces sp. CC53]